MAYSYDQLRTIGDLILHQYALKNNAITAYKNIRKDFESETLTDDVEPKNVGQSGNGVDELEFDSELFRIVKKRYRSLSISGFGIFFGKSKQLGYMQGEDVLKLLKIRRLTMNSDYDLYGPIVIDHLLVVISYEKIQIKFYHVYTEEWTTVEYWKDETGCKILYGDEKEYLTDDTKYHSLAAIDFFFLIKHPKMKLGRLDITFESCHDPVQKQWSFDLFHTETEKLLKSLKYQLQILKCSMDYRSFDEENKIGGPEILMKLWPYLDLDIIRSFKIRKWNYDEMCQPMKMSEHIFYNKDLENILKTFKQSPLEKITTLKSPEYDSNMLPEKKNETKTSFCVETIEQAITKMKHQTVVVHPEFQFQVSKQPSEHITGKCHFVLKFLSQNEIKLKKKTVDYIKKQDDVVVIDEVLEDNMHRVQMKFAYEIWPSDRLLSDKYSDPVNLFKNFEKELQNLRNSEEKIHLKVDVHMKTTRSLLFGFQMNGQLHVIEYFYSDRGCVVIYGNEKTLLRKCDYTRFAIRDIVRFLKHPKVNIELLSLRADGFKVYHYPDEFTIEDMSLRQLCEELAELESTQFCTYNPNNDIETMVRWSVHVNSKHFSFLTDSLSPDEAVRMKKNVRGYAAWRSHSMYFVFRTIKTIDVKSVILALGHKNPSEKNFHQEELEFIVDYHLFTIKYPIEQ